MKYFLIRKWVSAETFSMGIANLLTRGHDKRFRCAFDTFTMRIICKCERRIRIRKYSEF